MSKVIQREDGLFQEVDAQVGFIYGLAGKRGFGWSRKAIFNYCVKSCPDVRGFCQFEKWQKSYKLSELLKYMAVDQKSHVIKRMLMMQKNNTHKQELAELNK